MGNLLLDYQLSTSPQPLQTSTATTTTTGTIDVYVSEGTTTAYASTITIAVQIGPDPGAVFAQTPTAGVSTGKWTITSSVVDGRDIGLNPASYAQFIFTAQSAADYEISYNLVFSLTGGIVGTPGAGNLAVLEHAGTTSDPAKFTDNTGAFQLQLALPQLYLQNFVAAAKGAPTVPATEFALGAEIDLAWESNGTWFQLFKKGDAAPVYSGPASAYALTGGLSTDTTFFLTASLSGDPSQNGSFQPVVLYDALTVTISNPALTPSTVTASGAVSVGGALAVAGTSSLTGDTTVGGNLSASAVAASSLSVSGSASVAGTSTSGSVAAGSLSVNGNASLGGLTVSGPTNAAGLQVAGTLSIPGNSGTFAGGRAVAFNASGATWYTAQTDGFLVGSVLWDGNPSAHDSTMICVYSGAVGSWLYAMGGNYTAQTYGNVSWWMCGLPASVCVPVGAGMAFGVQQQNLPNNDSNAPCSAWFVPIGSGTPFAAAFTAMSAGFPEIGAPPSPARIQNGAETFVDMLAKSMHGPGGKRARRQFAELVKSIL